MDPDATYRIMTAPDSDLDERAVAAVDLLVWLADKTPGRNMNGVRTIGWPGSYHEVTALADECKTHIFRALDRLAELEAT